MLCYILFYYFFFAGGGGLVGGMSLSHVSQLLEVPGCFSITVITITVSLNCSLVHSVQF